MAIQENWDNSHFADYLLYGLWPPVKAWALLAGFDWHEDVDSEPELISFHNEGEEGYKDEMRFHEAEKRIYYKKKENLRRLHNFWHSDGLYEDSQTPKYYIDWALSKRFRPDWLDWAIENKLYVPKYDRVCLEDFETERYSAVKADVDCEPSSKPLNPRAENNYLRLIMQLAVSNIKDFDPKKPYEAAALIKANIDTELSEKTIAGYITKAHELESKERG